MLPLPPSPPPPTPMVTLPLMDGIKIFEFLLNNVRNPVGFVEKCIQRSLKETQILVPTITFTFKVNKIEINQQNLNKIGLERRKLQDLVVV